MNFDAAAAQVADPVCGQVLYTESVTSSECRSSETFPAPPPARRHNRGNDRARAGKEMQAELRDFVAGDVEAVNRVALAAFQQYSGQYADWEPFSWRIAGMDALAASAEIVVATIGGRPVTSTPQPIRHEP